MMNEACKMKLKEKLIAELMDEMDDKEAEKIKPKAAVVAVEKDPMEEPKVEVAMNEENKDDELSDDDLKKLLREYLG